MNSPELPYSLLVVDDQVTNLQLLRRFLTEYKIYTADSGALAIDKANELLPDLILLDINMPDLDGYQVCTQLKGHSATCDIPIIFITGLSEPNQINKGFQVGAIDYITKPFSLSEVKSRVQNQLALKSARESLKKKNLQLEKKIQEQTISSELARRVLQFINKYPARYIDLYDNLSLFVHLISLPCHDEGGDHTFVQTIACPDSPDLRTILSVKDQSGHSVNCILRSIVTDLAHNSILRKFPGIGIDESVTRLNNAVLDGGIFDDDNFFTGITAELQHDSLLLKYLSAGHPSIILIRGEDIILLPERGGVGANLPVAFTEDVSYTCASKKLLPGDKLLFFTDGLTDMSLDTIGSVFTINNLVKVLKEIICHKDLPVSAVINELLERLLQRCMAVDGEELTQFPDDITLMGVEIESIPKSETIYVVPADFANIDSCISHIVEKLLKSLSGRATLIDENTINIPVSESVLNTWKHAHKRDSKKEIGIHWWYSNDFNVEIISQGQGFAYERYKNPISAANLTNESGRGLFLVKKRCDYVRWRSNGRKIIMSFALNKSAWDTPAKQNDFQPFDIW